MNNTNPFIPQGSLMEQKNKQRARFRAAVIWVLALNFVLLIPGLLIQGCKDKDASADNQTSAMPTNDLAMTPQNTNVIAPPLSNAIPQDAMVPTNTVPPTAQQTQVTGTATTYKIQSGDSFYTIGKQFHVSTKAIQDANPGVDPKKLKLGKEINIPAPTAAAPTAVAGTVTGTKVAADSADLYTVKPHDNLTTIAKNHGTTPKAIMAINDLKTDRIKAGAKLKMPAAKTATSTTTPSADVAPITTPTARVIAPSAGPGTTGTVPATIR
jgi:LysM repeat protein